MPKADAVAPAMAYAARMDGEPSSTTLTIEIQRLMAEAAQRRKKDRDDPAIRGLMVRIDQLAQRRSSTGA